MATWSQAPTGVKSPPRTDDVNVLRDYTKTLADIVAIIAKDVSFILNGNVDGGNIKANSIEAKFLKVEELSAISANLGHITAGLIEAVQIYGSYIATSHDYPRAELNSLNNLISALSAPGFYTAFSPSGIGSVPSLVFVANNTTKAFMNRSSGGGSAVGTFDGELLNIQASSDLLLQSISGDISLTPVGNLRVNGYTGATASFYVSATPGGPANVQVNVHKGIVRN